MNENRKKLLTGAVALTSAAALALGLTACTSKSDRIEQFLTEKKYSEALQLFSEWKMNDQDKNDFVGRMKTKIEEAVSAYAKGDADYDATSEFVNTISKMKLSGLTESLDNAYAKMIALKNSKTEFENATRLFEEGNYIDAMYRFQNVIPEDCNYEQAQKQYEQSIVKYKEFVAKKANELKQQGLYPEAIQCLEDATYYLGDDSELAKMITDMNDDYLAYQKQQAKDAEIAEVEAFLKDQDYPSAIVSLEAFKELWTEPDEEIDQMLSDSRQSYIALIADKVEKLRENQKYLEALKMLDNAEAIVTDPSLTELRTVIENEKPIYLVESKYQSSNRYSLLEEGEEATDTLGNKYSYGNVFWISVGKSGWSEPDNGFVDYYVGYKYEKLKGVIAVDDGSSDLSANLVIEGDGVILYTLEMDRRTIPTEIEIDISNVNYLKLKACDISGEGNFNIILSDFIFEK